MATNARRRRGEENIANGITVTLQPVFGEVKTIRVPAESTVSEVLQAAGYSTSTEVRCNGEGVLDSDMYVEDGDRLTIVSESKIQNGLYVQIG